MSYDPNRPSDPPQVGSTPGGNSSYPVQPYVQPAQPYAQPAQYPVQSAPMSYGSPGAPDMRGYAGPTFIVRPKTNTMSVWAMWMGIIGLAGGTICSFLSFIPIIGWLVAFVALFLWLAPILAVIFGHIGVGQTRRRSEAGGGMAVAGLVMGYIGIVLAVLFVIALFFIFGSFLAIFGFAGAAAY